MNKLLLLILFLFTSCGIYTFSGSSLPSHLKTIEVPLFENEALIQGVAEDVTDAVITAVQRERLTIVPRDGDAIISGAVASYRNQAYDYSGDRENLNMKSYAVEITAQIIFTDQTTEENIYEGVLTGQGVYDFDTENEDIGRQRAVTDLVEKVLINSLQGW